MSIEARIAVYAAFALPILFALAFAREAMRDGLKFPRGWHGRQRRWRKWVVDHGFSRTKYQDNRLARVMCYDEFIEKRKNRRARFYSREYGFFHVGESIPVKALSAIDVREMAKNAIARNQV